MRGRLRAALVAGLCAGLAVAPAAADRGPTTTEGSEPQIAPGPIPHPAPEQLGPAVSRRLAAAREATEGAGLGAAERALAYGRLGSLYQTYLFFDAARAAYRHARHWDPEETRWLYYLAVVEGRRGDLEAATKAWEDLLSRTPDDPAALLHAAGVAVDQRRFEGARSYLERALRLDPGSAAAHAGLADIAAQEGRHADAEKAYAQALGLQPEADRLHYQRALALRNLGRVDEARDELQRAGKQGVRFADPLLQALVPESIGFHLGRGGRAQRSGDLATAVAEYRKALELDPESLTVLSSLGGALLLAGDAEAAAQTFEEAVELAPEEPRPHFDLATALLSGEPDEMALQRAEALLELAVALDGRYPEAHAQLARLHARRERFDEAETSYERWLELAPHEADARVERARNLVRLQRQPEAVDELRAAVATAPGHPQALLDLAALQQQAGDLPAAIETLRGLESAEQPFQRALGRFNIGNLYLAQGRRDDAVEEFRRALEAAPQLDDARFNLATTLLDLGRPAEVNEILLPLLGGEAPGEAVFLATGRALAQQGLFSQAIRRLEEGLEQHEQSPRLVPALVRILAAAPQPEARQPQRALQLADQHFQARRSLPAAETLALALAAVGRFEEAARLQTQLIAQAEASRLPDGLRRRFASNLQRYQASQPADYWP